MAGAASRPQTRNGGQSGRGGRGAVPQRTSRLVSRNTTQPSPRVLPPPPPPPPPRPPPLDNANADEAGALSAAAELININDSPATRTRRQLMLAIQGGSNTAGRRPHSDNNLDDDSPARRTRQRLAQIDGASDNGAGNNYMRRLFGAQSAPDSDEDINPDDPIDEDDDYVEEPAGEIAPAAVGGGHGMVGQGAEVQYGANRLTNVGRDWLLEKCVKEQVLSKNKICNLEWQSGFQQQLQFHLQIHGGENESGGREC